MKMLCLNVSPCDSSPNPLLGFSSEAPDTLNYIGIGFAPVIPPLLGSTWDRPTAFVALDVPVGTPGDQETADLLAESAAFQQAAAGWKTADGFPVITYQSAEQRVTETCPDGSSFVFGVIPGLFTALTQAEADGAALSYCQRQIQLHRVCLTASLPVLCLNEYGSGDITATGFSLKGPQENLWEMTGGELPLGMVFNGGSIPSSMVQITGVPTVPGTYSFSVKVTTPQGDFMENTFTIKVVGVTSTALPGTQVGEAYSFQLVWVGFDAPVFTVDPSSSLPTGLTMTPGGLISGTPLESGNFTTVIDVSDMLVFCVCDISLAVSAFPVYQVTPAINGGATAYFNGGANIPAGNYQVTYLGGGVISAGQHYLSVGPLYQKQWQIAAGDFPGGLQQFPATTTGFPTLAAVQAANNGASYQFAHSGGPIGMVLPPPGGVNPVQPDSPTPTFALTRLS